MKITRDRYAIHHRWRQPKYYPTKEELLLATECNDIQEVCNVYGVTKATCNRFIKHGLFEENAKELVYQWDDENDIGGDFDRLLEKVKTLKLCFMDREMWRNNE